MWYCVKAMDVISGGEFGKEDVLKSFDSLKTKSPSSELTGAENSFPYDTPLP